MRTTDIGSFIDELQLQIAGHVALKELDPAAIKPHRRKGKGIFVVSVIELPSAQCTIQDLYPVLVRSLSNLLITIEAEHPDTVHLVTPERAHVVLQGNEVLPEIRKRIKIFADARLVIDNIFDTDLEPELWNGDEHTEAIARAGRGMGALDLLPPPVRLEELLSPRDLRFIKRAYGIGGLSAGNFSERLDAERFWMSASGIDKAQMREVGRDFLLVKGFDEAAEAIRLSVPPNIEPRRVSVDAIEHWLIYKENPDIKAILHVHAWMPGIPCTDVQLPCGTYEVGVVLAELLRAEPDPVHAVIGQKNHGLTITGTSLDEIMERVSAQLVSEIPMS